MLLLILFVMVSMICVTPSIMYVMDNGIKGIRIKDAICLAIFLPGAIVVGILGGIVYLCTSGILDKTIFKQDK